MAFSVALVYWSRLAKGYYMSQHALVLSLGAAPNIGNNENKTPLDLAKDPECAAMLRRCVMPRQISQDYGDEEDSD